jgi:hypothetical protein
MVKLTVLTNVYNEEYLLPFWLEHHRKIFDHGIIFDWQCTDRSMDIVREMCPTWEIRKAADSHPDKKLDKFDAFDNDILLMVAEMKIDGYKIVLNTTEFLMSPEPIRTYLSENPNSYYPLHSMTALSSKEIQEPTTLRELFDGIERVEKDIRGFRMIHSWDHGHYSLGRHERTLPETDWIPATVLWLAEYPWNSKVLKRGLQMMEKIPDSDYEKGISFHHRFTAEQRTENRLKHFETSVPIAEVPHLAKALL